MNTITFNTVEAHAGEPVEISFPLTDIDGADIDLTGAAAEFRIARRNGDAALLIVADDDIDIAGSTVVASFQTADLVNGALEQLTGRFFGQLFVTKSGDTLVVAEGFIIVRPIIQGGES